MNSISYKTFIGLFQVIFFTFITGASILITFELSNFVREEYEGHYSIGSFRADALVKPDSEKILIETVEADVSNSYLQVSNWKLAFTSKDGNVKGFMLILITIRIAYVFLIFFILRKFVLSLKSKEIFSTQNIKRLRQMALLIVFIEPLQWVGSYLVRHWITNHFQIKFQNKSVGYQIGYEIGYFFGSGDFLWNWILTGLLLLVIADVFRRGLKMKEEQDLTI